MIHQISIVGVLVLLALGGCSKQSIVGYDSAVDDQQSTSITPEEQAIELADEFLALRTLDWGPCVSVEAGSEEGTYVVKYATPPDTSGTFRNRILIVDVSSRTVWVPFVC